MRDAERSFRLPAGPLRDAVEKMADQQVDDIVRSLTKGDESQQGARVQFCGGECSRAGVGNECRCPECVEREVANAESLGAAQQERGL